MVMRGKKYFNNGSPAGSLQSNRNRMMATIPEIMTTNGGRPIAGHQKRVTTGLQGPLLITPPMAPQPIPGAVKAKSRAVTS